MPGSRWRNLVLDAQAVLRQEGDEEVYVAHIKVLEPSLERTEQV